MKTKLFSIADSITSEETFSERTTKLLAILFLVVATALCLKNYSALSLHFLSKTYPIKPTLISGAAALAMLTPLYARGYPAMEQINLWVDRFCFVLDRVFGRLFPSR